MVQPGPGKRMITEDNITIRESVQNRRSQQLASSDSSSDLLQAFLHERRPAIVLADSMGECFRTDDDFFTPVVKSAYNFEWMAKDIVDGVININRYKNVVIWAGAHSIHRIDFDQVEADLRGLVNVLAPRNRKAIIYISTLIPKPRENHITAPKFYRFNQALENVVSEFQKTGQEVFCLRSHEVFLDHNNDIIRPIVGNFEDGFHLNPNGADKLRTFWLENLCRVDYVWHL